MKRLLVVTVLALICFTTLANASITVSLLGPMNDKTFNNNPVGAYTGTSYAVYEGGGSISFSAGLDTTGVTDTTTGSAAIPLGDTPNFHYLWGLVNGTTVTFTNAPIHWFIIHWGSVDSLAGDGYDNVLTLSNGDVITGTDLVALGLALGTGSQTNPADNPWLLISDDMSFSSFTATSPQNAFEFDMVTPEPSSLLLLGTGLLGAVGVVRRKINP